MGGIYNRVLNKRSMGVFMAFMRGGCYIGRIWLALLCFG